MYGDAFMKRLTISTVIIFTASVCHGAPPPPNLFSNYQKSINSEAEAETIEMHKVLAKSIENKVRIGKKKGYIVDKPTDNDQFSVDSAGNITVKEGASVDTIINNMDISDTTIIYNNHDSNH